MIFEEFAPRFDSSSHLLCRWRFALDEADTATLEHLIVPDGTVTIVVERAPGEAITPMLMGPSMRAHVATVRRGVAYAGLRLRPGASWPLLRIEAPRLRDRIEPLFLHRADLAARIAAFCAVGELDEALEATIAPLTVEAQPIDPAVSRAVAILVDSHGEHPVSALADGAGLGERQLRRRFSAVLGLLPKEFARIQRMRRIWTLAMERAQASWSDLSAEAGNADQAHLGREIARAFGAPPRLVEAYLRTIRHRLVDPAASMSEKYKTVGAVGR